MVSKPQPPFLTLLRSGAFKLCPHVGDHVAMVSNSKHTVELRSGFMITEQIATSHPPGQGESRRLLPSVTEYLSETGTDSTSYGWVSLSQLKVHQARNKVCFVKLFGVASSLLSFLFYRLASVGCGPYSSGRLLQKSEGPIESGLVHWIPVETEVLAGDSWHVTQWW